MFRFSIRELVLLTAVAGCAVGWGLDHVRQAAQLHTYQASAQLWEHRAGAVVDALSDTGWRFEWTPGGVNVVSPTAVE